MVGELARQDEYGYSDLGIPIAPQIEPPKVTDFGQTDLRKFAMGALAQQRDYQPTDARGTDLWGHHTTAGNITPQDIDKATSVALATSGGGLATKGIKAYHGSPHDFERFDLSKIGTGEGAQAYGHGLYFAGNEGVALGYKTSVQRNMDALREIAQQHGLTGDAAEMLAHQYSTGFGGKRFDDWIGGLRTAGDDPLLSPRVKAAAQQLTDKSVEASDAFSRMKAPGHMYEVNINADPAQMLDWDKRLSEMSPQVQEALNKAWLAHPEAHAKQFGSQIYDIAGMQSGMAGTDASQYATRKLEDAGIPGIKYLDAGSRGPQVVANLGGRPVTPRPPTSNYVVFDPSIIDIMRKYGIAGAAPAGMGALAAQDQYRNP